MGCINFGEGRLAARVGGFARRAELLERLDRVADASGGPATAARRIAGFPYLRVDATLVVFARRPLTDAEYDRWVEAMAALDRAAREIELARGTEGRAMGAAAWECADRLRLADAGSPRTRTLLRERVASIAGSSEPK